jgi:putative methionine-R-sulfoxide reductase with GAF domain/streptogramin lyase
LRPLAAIPGILFIVLFLSEKTYGQFPDYHAQLIDERSGVKTESILDFLKDSQGFLWILSNSHVQCFDGRQVKLFKPDRLLTSLYCDKAGRIWCASTRKIFRFENDIKGFVPVQFDTANPSMIRHLARWPDGRTVVVRQKDIQYYRSDSQRFVKMRTPSLEKDLEQFLLFQQGISTNWPKDTLSLFNVTRNMRYTLPLHGISRIITLGENYVLMNSVRTSMLIYKLGDAKPAPLLSLLDKSSPKLPLITVYAAAAIDKDRYLLPSNYGLFLLDLSTLSLRKLNLFADGKPLQNEGSMRNIYIDPGGMAFLTHETGILTFHTRKSVIGLIRNFKSEPGEGFSNEVNSVLFDNQHNFWIATERGFTRWNLATNEFKTFMPGNVDLKYDLSIYSMVFDGKNLLVGSAGHGLYIFNPETETFHTPVAVTNDSITHRLLTRGSGRVIKQLRAGTYLVNLESKYFKLHTGDYRIEKYPLEKEIGAAFTALPLANGNIWIGTQSGLFCVDSAFHILMQAPEHFSRSRHIYSLCETTDGKILVGSRGLYEIKKAGDRIDVVMADSFFVDKVIQILFRDKNDNIWVGTDDGLFRYDTRTRYIQSFNSESAQVKGYHNNGVYVANDGTVFLSGNYGINYLRPEKIPLKETPVDVFVTKFSVNDDDSSYLPNGNHWQLSHAERSIAIEFAAPYFENAWKPVYRYKLEGVDNSWLQAANTGRVRYSSLLPGDYTFNVAVSVDGIHWYENKKQLSFTINIPWWQTWWAGTILALLIMGLFAIAFFFRKKTKQGQEVRKMIDYFANSGYEHSSVDDILWDIARNCISRLDFEDCVIYTVDEERGMLQQKAAYGPKAPKAFEIMNPIKIPLGKGIVGTVAQTGKPEVVSDTTRDRRYIVDDKARLSEITVPIVHEGNVIGIIDSEHRRRNFFKQKHVQVLQTIANLCSAKISRGMALDAMRKSKLQLMELNMKMAESKFLNLRLQMNPHFLFNSLSSIQHLVVSQQTSRAYKYLTVFSNLLRSLLQYAESNFISLDKEMAMLRMYLDLETLRFDELFKYTIDVDESLTQEDVLLPSLMVQPFAENAIWHGLMHKEGDKKLHIRFKNHQDDFLTCIIEDNGIGRRAAAAIRKKNISSMVHESKGIRIIEERLSLLQQKTGKPARVEIIDQADDAGQSAGTKVVIVIPFYNKEEV